MAFRFLVLVSSLPSSSVSVRSMMMGQPHGADVSSCVRERECMSVSLDMPSFGHHRLSFKRLSAALAAASLGDKPRAVLDPPPSFLPPDGIKARCAFRSSAARNAVARRMCSGGLCTVVRPPSFPQLGASNPSPVPEIPLAISSSHSSLISSRSL